MPEGCYEEIYESGSRAMNRGGAKLYLISTLSHAIAPCNSRSVASNGLLATAGDCMMKYCKAVIVISYFVGVGCLAQNITDVEAKPYGSYGGGTLDTVDL